MRVGVTGSSGFIGTTLVSALTQRGDDVIRFVRPSTSIGQGLSVRWDPWRGVVDDGDLARAGGFDAFVNLAGAGIGDRRWTERRQAEIRISRVNATTLLTKILSESSSSTFLASGSAIGVYGSRGDEVLDESSTRGDDFLARVCTEWEDATSPLSDAGVPVAHLRSGIVMSRRGGALKRQLPLFRAGLGGCLGTGAQWVSPISLRDEVRAIMFLIDNRLSGPFNLVAPAALTNRSLTTALSRELHRPARLRTPSAVLRLVLGRDLVDGAVLASQRVSPTALVQSGFEFESPNIESILSTALR